MKGIKIAAWTTSDGELYLKKPIPVRAKQIHEDFWVPTLEGNHQGKKGDYLMCGIRGELYICDKEIFEESFELLKK